MLYHARSRKAASQTEQQQVTQENPPKKCHKEKQDVTNSSPVKTVLESLSHSNVRESKQVLKI